MRIPFLSSCADSCNDTWDALLHPRSPVPEPKGGGGRGGGSKGSSSGSKGSSTGHEESSSSSGSKSGSSGSKGSKPSSPPPVGSRGSTVPVSGTTFGSGLRASTPYGNGGVKVTTIPQGQPFAGRTYGGATRDDVYGTSVYGSGYPGVAGSGVAGRGFPYVYPPVVWTDYGYGPHYLHASHEYGEPQNTNRTGGPEMQAAFSSPSSNSTFHIIADNSTVVSLVGSVRSSCSGKFSSNSSTSPSPYGASPSDPRPEGAIQYYRASSVVLALDGYNNTAALSLSSDGDADANAAAVALPHWVDMHLLSCLTSTIGQAAPLFGSADQDATATVRSGCGRALSGPGTAGTLGLVVVVVLWHLRLLS